MGQTPYTKEEWRSIDVEQLLAHVAATASLAERHYNDEDMDAFAATVGQLREQVDVLYERRDELAALVAERAAAAGETAVSPALEEPPGE